MGDLFLEDFNKTYEIVSRHMAQEYGDKYSLEDIVVACQTAIYQAHKQEPKAILLKSKKGESGYCSQCGYCCREYNIILRMEDIYKLSKVVDITGNIEPAPNNPGYYRFKTKPCKYLQDNGRCSCYHNRPITCKNHPLTDMDNPRVIREPNCDYIIQFFIDKSISLLTGEPFK